MAECIMLTHIGPMSDKYLKEKDRREFKAWDLEIRTEVPITTVRTLIVHHKHLNCSQSVP